MVEGFESFRKWFKGYEDCYTIIGGTACDILMSEATLDFRATRDVDMILLIENRFAEFSSLFWEYIEAGGYRCGWRNSELPHFYRFTEPQSKEYPAMIELFSRRPDFQMKNPEVYLTPLPISDEISSLSAIMLDEDYYNLMLAGRRIVDGVSVLGAEYLILFKVKAWIDLKQKKADGLHVNERDLRKHKNDIFRLYMIVEPSSKIILNEKVMADVHKFIEMIVLENVNLSDIGIKGVTFEEILEQLKKIYLLG